MLGFNWIDVIIIVLLALAAWRGFHVNFWSQLLTIAGFFSGLLLSNWLLSLLLKPHISSTNFAVISANLTLIAAVFMAIVGNTLGYRVRFHFSKGNHQMLQRGLSIGLSVFSVLIAAWLLAATLGRLPFEGLSNSADDALIVQSLDKALPSQPTFFSMLDRYVNPNSSPNVYVSSETADPLSAKQQVGSHTSLQKTSENSVVRITGFGCGSIVAGSGFVVAPQLVITNAHVIAGVHRPIVKHKNDSYEAVPVYFDALKDVAILRVNGLNAAPLELATQNIPKDTPIFVLGYPNGNFATTPGVVADRVTAYGQSIYNVGFVDRDVYELQADIKHGNSGGPLILADGRAAGMIFAKSNVIKDYGYALSAQSISLSVLQILASSKRVGTGACAA